jgi:hypothetical protein
MKMLLRAALVLSGLQLAAIPAASQPVDPLANNAAALAAAGDTASQVAFAYADRNADLLVSWEEYRNRALRLFTHVDTNEDGVMQIAELAALAGPSAPAAPFDVSAGTFNAAARKAFDDADKDNNGALTPAEWAKVLRPSKLF